MRKSGFGQLLGQQEARHHGLPVLQEVVSDIDAGRAETIRSSQVDTFWMWMPGSHLWPVL